MSVHGPPPSVRAPDDFRRPWLRSERPVPRLFMRPIERFLQLEAGSAALLMVAAVAALIWSNTAMGSYDGFWSTRVELQIGGLTLEEDLRHVVNDLLMAVFFYVVALEVKREMLFGSLRDVGSAAVPAAAAIGTMVGGAAAYLVINVDGGELSGLAVPAATDIAFALGVLGLAGRRAPPGLRAFLLTLAVVDDIATIAIIALFYSTDVSLAWLAMAAGVIGLIVVSQRVGIRALTPYVLFAAALWLAVFESGVHATIAGVVLGFLTPATAFHSRQATGEVIGGQLSKITGSGDREVSEGTIFETSRLAREAVSPLTRLETQLHPWSAYVILPLFALANAGVPVSLAGIGDALTAPVGLGIFLGLVVGAPIGGIVFAWLIVRFGRARLPEGLDWPAIAGVAPLKGIGFTVAIFISALAFDSEILREQAKLAILVGSALAGMIGLVVLYTRHWMMRRHATGAAQTGGR